MPPKRDPSTNTATDAGAPSNNDSDSSDDELYAFKIKPKEPPMFSGNPSASISAKEWLNRLNAYFGFSQHKLKDPMKTLIAVTYLESTAAHWYQDIFSLDQAPPTFVQFLEKFKQQFIVESENEASWKIEKIFQGSRTLNEYIAEFRLLKTEAGTAMTDTALRRHFIRGLRSALRDSVDEATFNSPSFDDLVISIKRKDEYLRMRDGNYSRTTASVSKPSFKSNFNTLTSGSQFRVTTKLSDSERQYLKDNKGCFRCREINANYVAANYLKFINNKLASIIIKREESIS